MYQRFWQNFVHYILCTRFLLYIKFSKLYRLDQKFEITIWPTLYDQINISIISESLQVNFICCKSSDYEEMEPDYQLWGKEIYNLQPIACQFINVINR